MFLKTKNPLLNRNHAPLPPNSHSQSQNTCTRKYQGKSHNPPSQSSLPHACILADRLTGDGGKKSKRKPPQPRKKRYQKAPPHRIISCTMHPRCARYATSSQGKNICPRSATSSPQKSNPRPIARFKMQKWRKTKQKEKRDITNRNPHLFPTKFHGGAEPRLPEV